jgi:hypothetical protein
VKPLNPTWQKDLIFGIARTKFHFLVAFEKYFLEVDYLGQSKILKACFHSIIDLGRN